MNILKKLFDHEYKELKRFGQLADKVEKLDEEYQKLSDDELFCEFIFNEFNIFGKVLSLLFIFLD